MNTKICKRCQLELPLNKFHRNKQSKTDGYHGVCIRCRHLSALGYFAEQLQHGPIAKDPIVAFWSKVEKTDGGCWIWKGSQYRGSAIFSWGGHGKVKSMQAHRWAFQYQFGFPIPRNVYLSRNCKNNLCVNPCHFGKNTTD